MNCPIIKPNEGIIDRVGRVVLGVIFLLISNYWVGGLPKIALLVLGIVMVLTSISGFCGLYTLIKVKTCKEDRCKNSLLKIVLLLALGILLYVLGSYASISITKKKFMEDFGRINGYYKQALFLTGQNKREEAKEQYNLFVDTLGTFSKKYSSYKPYFISKDTNFNADLSNVISLASTAKVSVYTGDLTLAHKQLEEVRPILQSILKRNGVSSLATALVDFHDIMEKLITASDKKDADEVLRVYEEANSALKTVEEEDNSAGVGAIRLKLEELKTLASNKELDKLSAKAQELKTSFVKVYLIKG